MYWHLNGTVEAQTWRFHCSSFMCERLNQMDKYWKRTYTFKSLYWLTATVCFAIQEFVCREISRGIFRFCWCLLLCFVLRVQMYDQLTWPGRLHLSVRYGIRSFLTRTFLTHTFLTRTFLTRHIFDPTHFWPGTFLTQHIFDPVHFWPSLFLTQIFSKECILT